MGCHNRRVKYRKYVNPFGKWTPQISSPTTSSNRRELIGVHKVVELAVPILKEKNWTSIKVLTDNQTTAYNINRKSAARSLTPSTRKFLEMIQKESLQVKADYILGEENQNADSLSRLEKAGEYSLHPKVFCKAVRHLNLLPDVNLFASKYNHLLPTFGSLRKSSRNPNNLGNALNISWENMCPLLHPPIPLISRVLDKFKVECRERLLVIPNWPGQKYDNLLEPLVVQKRILRLREQVLIEGYRMKKCIDAHSEKKLTFPVGGIGNVPVKKQFSSFYSKPSSLLTPYILLQPEINIGKTIWHISKIYRNLIGEPSKFT
jgi:hypothetical protein